MQIVDKNSIIPLHTQLSSIIRRMIENKELKEGDAIMPERELCIMQNVSRMTVNKAIMGLVQKDYYTECKAKAHLLRLVRKSISFLM